MYETIKAEGTKCPVCWKINEEAVQDIQINKKLMKKLTKNFYINLLIIFIFLY